MRLGSTIPYEGKAEVEYIRWCDPSKRITKRRSADTWRPLARLAYASPSELGYIVRWKCGQKSEEGKMKFARITVNPKQMDGLPCIRGLRIPVATLVGMVADGMTEDEILKAYPDLEREDIRDALRFAAEAVRERELPLVNGR